MVFGAILTGGQSGQKLQCLYGNTMANIYIFYMNVVPRSTGNTNSGTENYL